MHQSEWATDVSFESRSVLEPWYERWVRHALLNYDSTDVLKFLGRSGRLRQDSGIEVHTSLQQFEESWRLKHWVDSNSQKMYDHGNVLRVETTINEPKGFRVYRTKVGEPDGEKAWRVLRRNVADLHRRAQVSEAANERYLESLSDVAETKTVEELVTPWCRRVKEPGKGGRLVRALNPMSAEDVALLKAVSDPKWQINGLRNRDLAGALYGEASEDPAEKKRRSASISRQLRLLRAHEILKKVPKTHRYLVCAKARAAILALLAARHANPNDLTARAA